MPFENLKDQKAIMRRKDLTATEKWIAVVALSFRNSQDGRCDPPVESDDPETDTLCSLSGYTRPCVKKALDGLEAKGIIERVRKTARPSQINFLNFTRNDVTRNDFTGNDVTRNEVSEHPKLGYGLPVTTLRQTDKEQISTDKSSFSSLAFSETQTPDLFGGENSGSNCVDHTPADGDGKNCVNPLNQKENGGAETLVRTTADKDPIPYQRIADIYNERCVPPLPRAMNPSDTLKRNIRARCKDLKTIKGIKTVSELLNEFAKFFDLVAQSDWLCGRNGGWGKCNFPWLMQREKFENTLNGLYSNRPDRSELPDHLNPRIRFDKAYYEQDDPFNPDGSLNWKRKK